MIYTWSQFNYGHTVTTDNQTLIFAEGSGQAITAQIEVGSYTLGELADAVANTLNGAGTLNYFCTINRDTNTITISASGPIILLTNSSAATAYELLGFDTATSLSGASSYTAPHTCGKIYKPQFMVQSYTPSTNFAESLDATVNRAASGRVELVRFGVLRRIELEIKFITNLPMDGVIIRDNGRGLEDVLEFLNYATSKARFEFVPDETEPDVYQKVILDKTESSSEGTGYKLKELYSDNVPDVYETGVLTLQVVQ